MVILYQNPIQLVKRQIQEPCCTFCMMYSLKIRVLATPPNLFIAFLQRCFSSNFRSQSCSVFYLMKSNLRPIVLCELAVYQREHAPYEIFIMAPTTVATALSHSLSTFSSHAAP